MHLSISALLVSLVFVIVIADESQSNINAEFKQWAKERNISWKNIDIGSTEHGRGVIAQSFITKGDEILRIPESILLAQPNFPITFTYAVNSLKLTPTNVMALFLLYEKQNPQSKWSKYIAALPTTIDTPLFFNETELSWLQASSLVENINLRKLNAEKYYNIIISSLFDNEESEEWEEDKIEMEKFSFAEWKWALSMLWSRAFSIKIHGKTFGCLVPFADMFNCQDPVYQPLQVTAEFKDNYLRYYAAVDIPKGSEILMPYGKNKNHSNVELLLDYGFVREKNIYDFVCVRNPYFNRAEKEDQSKIALLNAMNVWKENFCWKDAELPWDWIWTSRVMDLTDQQFNRERDNINSELFRNQDLNSSPFGFSNNAIMKKKLIATLRELLAQYSTSIEEDEQTIGKIDLSKATAKDYTYYSAVVVRSGEKKILKHLLIILEKPKATNSKSIHSSKDII